MKQKYTLTVANSEINIITDLSREEIDDVVGVVDRRMREIHLHSKNCSRTDAAVLLCLDYCAEKMELQKTLKALNSQIEHLNIQAQLDQKEIAALTREIEILRASIGIASAHRSKKVSDTQIGFDDISDDEKLEIPELEEPSHEEKAPETAIEKILAEDEVDTQEAVEPTSEPEHEKLHAKARKKKVRAMFDMISFDDI